MCSLQTYKVMYSLNVFFMVILLLQGLKMQKMPFHSLGPIFDLIHFDLLGKIACNIDTNLIR